MSVSSVLANTPATNVLSLKLSALNVENQHIILYCVQKPRIKPHPIVVMSNLFKIQLTQSVTCVILLWIPKTFCYPYKMSRPGLMVK